MKRKEIIDTLSQIDVSKYVEQKMGLNYLSWANAWAILIQYYPDATYEFVEYPEYFVDATKNWVATGRTVDYRMTSAGCEVTAIVNIGGEKFSMSLYVMDNRNKPVINPNYSQINKTQQRCLVKALALAGLGLNLYQGEDLPASENIKRKGIDPEQQKKQKELGEAKREYLQLMPKVADSTGRDTSSIQSDLNDLVKSETDILKKYQKMNEHLRDMLKSCDATEQMSFEEVK